MVSEFVPLGTYGSHLINKCYKYYTIILIFFWFCRVRVLEEQFPKHGMADDREGSFPQKLASTDSDQLQYKDDPEWKNKSAHLKMDTVSPESIISVKTTPVAQKGFYAQQEQEQKREMLLHMTIHEVCKYSFCSM